MTSLDQVRMAVTVLVQYVQEAGPEMGGREIGMVLRLLLDRWPDGFPGGREDWFAVVDEVRKVLSVEGRLTGEGAQHTPPPSRKG